MAVLAIYYGLKTQSEAIMLDGYYSLAGFVLAMISLWVIRVIKRPESLKFNFGYSSIEPLFNLVKGLMILAVVLSSLINSVTSLIEGGNTPGFGDSIIYFIISTVGCFVLTLVFYFSNKKHYSPIIHVEYKNWYIDTLISGSVGIAFMMSFFLQDTQFDYLVKFTDPVATLLIIVLVVKLPFDTVKIGLKEILLSAPESVVTEKMKGIIKNRLSDYDFVDFNIKASKTGREHYLLVNIQVINKNNPLFKLGVQDEFRDKLKADLKKNFEFIKLDVVFSQNKIEYDY
jgi:cation diffusion facilitator family transporter